MGKCKIMHFGARNMLNKYTMNGQEMKVVEVEKDVGVMVTKAIPTVQCSSWQG